MPDNNIELGLNHDFQQDQRQQQQPLQTLSQETRLAIKIVSDLVASLERGEEEAEITEGNGELDEGSDLIEDVSELESNEEGSGELFLSVGGGRAEEGQIAPSEDQEESSEVDISPDEDMDPSPNESEENTFIVRKTRKPAAIVIERVPVSIHGGIESQLFAYSGRSAWGRYWPPSPNSQMRFALCYVVAERLIQSKYRLEQEQDVDPEWADEWEQWQIANSDNLADWLSTHVYFHHMDALIGQLRARTHPISRYLRDQFPSIAAIVQSRGSHTDEEKIKLLDTINESLRTRPLYDVLREYALKGRMAVTEKLKQRLVDNPKQLAELNRDLFERIYMGKGGVGLLKRTVDALRKNYFFQLPNGKQYRLEEIFPDKKIGINMYEVNRLLASEPPEAPYTEKQLAAKILGKTDIARSDWENVRNIRTLKLFKPDVDARKKLYAAISEDPEWHKERSQSQYRELYSRMDCRCPGDIRCPEGTDCLISPEELAETERIRCPRKKRVLSTPNETSPNSTEDYQ